MAIIALQLVELPRLQIDSAHDAYAVNVLGTPLSFLISALLVIFD
jgi:hypothetical protein